MCIRVIGVSAKMGCGKTYFSNFLINVLGPRWKRISFGDAVKQDCAAKFNFPLKWCYSEEGKNKNVPPRNFKTAPHEYMTVREILQWWGTDVCRAEDPNYWIKRNEKIIMELSKYYVGVVIDDIRFPNEYDICEMTVRLDAYNDRPDHPGDDHESETALDSALIKWSWRTKPAYGELDHAAHIFVGAMRAQGRL